MNILRLAFELFVVYILYKFIFGFIIPIYQTTKQMKGKMNEMQEKMNRQQQPGPAPAPQAPIQKTHTEDYIDYEEVK